MPYGGEDRSPEYYQELKKRRDAYEAKLIAKGVVPRSSKMLILMHRKFH